MKRNIIAIMVLLWGTVYCYAENVINVVPLQTRAGVSVDEGECIAFEMTNEEANIVGLSFLVKLPEGMSFDDSDLENLPPFELVLDRFPYTGRGNNKQYQHSVGCNKKEDGWWMVTISSTALNPIKENEGVILQGYYQTDASMQPGVYPIMMKDIKLAISGTQKAEGPSTAVSYVTIGDNSPIQTQENIDLSNMTGYLSSVAVEALNDELATNNSLVTVNMSGVTGLGADLVVPENVVWWTANEAGLQRSFPAIQWSTVCLPFPLSEEQVTDIKAQGVEIEHFTGYDEASNEVSFVQVNEMEANKPYIVKCTSAQSPFEKIEDVATDGSLTIEVLGSGNVSMLGTFSPLTLNSTDDITYFVYDAADGNFVRVGKNCTVPPFRAYFVLNKASSARQLTIRHEDDDTSSVIDLNNINPKSDSSVAYDLQGKKTVNAKRNTIIIRNGQKRIVK